MRTKKLSNTSGNVQAKCIVGLHEDRILYTTCVVYLTVF